MEYIDPVRFSFVFPCLALCGGVCFQNAAQCVHRSAGAAGDDGPVSFHGLLRAQKHLVGEGSGKENAQVGASDFVFHSPGRLRIDFRPAVVLLT